RRTSTNKLTSFELLDSFNWTSGELLYNIFRLTDEQGDVTHCSLQHAMSVSHFLKGRSTYGVGMVLEAWFRSSDGAQVADTQESLQMYGMAVQYKDIRAAR
ncbi:uncharacterized protein EDB91DRAFT_1031572, partial [Suillus paluster]|uniref:uncharacterized protein n=1 Tax=Suillus paluster TaxID=48578 RepID=UPI001B87099E